jgi:hypothetical protein
MLIAVCRPRACEDKEPRILGKGSEMFARHNTKLPVHSCAGANPIFYCRSLSKVSLPIPKSTLAQFVLLGDLHRAGTITRFLLMRQYKRR